MVVDRQDRNFQTWLTNFGTVNRLPSRHQLLPYNLLGTSSDISHLSTPQPSLDRTNLEPESENPQLMAQHITTPTHDDDHQDTKQLHGMGDSDIARLIMSWEATASHVHGKEAAELGAKMHNVSH